MDNAAKAVLHRTPALAELLDSLGGPEAISTLAELLDELPVGMVLVGADDASLPVLYASSKARQIAWSDLDDSEELAGRPLAEVLPGSPELVEAVREAQQSGGPRRLRYGAPGGQTCQFEAVSLRRRPKSGARVLLTWRLLPPESGHEQPGREAVARRPQLGVDLALGVAGRLEPEAVVERILQRALEAVEADRAMLGRMGSGVQCTILGSVDRRGEPPPVGSTISLEGQEAAEQAIATRRPAQGRVAYERIGMRQLRWSLVMPLVVEGQLIALLAVGRDEDPFDDEEKAVLEQIGAVAALALRNATLFQSLRDASRVRSQFLNMAAHELRTPLSVIAGYVSMLDDGTLGPGPAAWEAPLSVLVDKTREVAHLVDDILLAGRLEMGVARTSGRSMDLSESLQEAARRAGPRAALLAADLSVRTPDSAVRVWADADHVGRILDNLLNNAFSYSVAPPRVRLAVDTEDGSAVVTVEDSGRGIGPDHRERIFQQFYRVEDQAQGYPPGTGLGLFISRALAERNGGRLDLEWSEPGVGSRFALRLPLASAA
jgi:signal transduction histidine kinase